MHTLRYEHRYAKRDHKSVCDMTGLLCVDMRRMRREQAVLWMWPEAL